MTVHLILLITVTVHLIRRSSHAPLDRSIRAELNALSPKEAFIFLRAINIGHPGSLTTLTILHADTPARAVEQLALMVLQSGAQLRREDVLSHVDGAVDIFVQLECRNGHRWVSQIEWKAARQPRITVTVHSTRKSSHTPLDRGIRAELNAPSP